jgi:GMP synthase (glutamine-hydrolysing)
MQRLHIFQHTPHEGAGEIAAWAKRRGHALTTTHLYRGETPPPLEAIDWLIVLGGPMNIYEYRNHPWLVAEKNYLRAALSAGKTVLGICLGSQLIADALGGKVFQNPEIEIGWLPVTFDAAAVQPGSATPMFAGFPSTLVPLHWHGDTFSLPPGAVNLASSEGCRHQAFAVGDRVVGLQFHLEVGHADVVSFMEGDPILGEGTYIQSSTTILEAASMHLPAANAALERLLEALEKATESQS